jgi:hypothetical protein
MKEIWQRGGVLMGVMLGMLEILSRVIRNSLVDRATPPTELSSGDINCLAGRMIGRWKEMLQMRCPAHCLAIPDSQRYCRC